MKKIYALMAVTLAGVMSASAFTAFEGGKKEQPRMPFPASQAVKAPNLKDAKTFTLNGFSRAEEEVEVNAELINSFNQGLYFLYQNNFFDENGQEVEKFRNVQTCAETVLEATQDLSKIYLKSLMGFECMGDGLELNYNAETRKYDMELGQDFLQSNSGANFVIGTLDKSGVHKTGTVSFQLYANGLVCEYDQWLVGVLTQGGKDNVYIDLACADLRILQPNATLSYAWTQPKDGAVKDINKDVLFEIYEPDPEDPNDLGGFLISNVMPFEDGLVTYFDNTELATKDIVIMYNGAPVNASVNVSENEMSGDFIMYSYSAEAQQYAEYVFADYDLVTETFKWPVLPEVLATEFADFAGFTSWTTHSINNYTNGTMSQATITKKPTSISAVEAEAVEGPAEYYNLQGMKVANPAAGQIYIVKEGSKVSKRVF